MLFTFLEMRALSLPQFYICFPSSKKQNTNSNSATPVAKLMVQRIHRTITLTMCSEQNKNTESQLVTIIFTSLNNHVFSI